MESTHRPLRVAILSCEDALKWEGLAERLYGGLLEIQTGDTVETFRCPAGEFPDPGTVRQQYDVILISGSHYSVYDEVAWIRRLEELLPRYVAAGVRLLGCCFGHQILSQALGGRVGRNPSGRFVLGVEQVKVDTRAARRCGLHLRTDTESNREPHTSPGEEEAPQGQARTDTVEAEEAEEQSGPPGQEQERSQLHGGRQEEGGQQQQQQQEAERPGVAGCGRGVCRLRLLQSHGDQVLALPPGAQLLATSGTAAFEMWALPHRVLSFQFHPELTPDMVYDKIWTALSGSGRLSAEEAAAAEAALRAGPAGVDTDVFARALQAFVRAPLPPPQAEPCTAPGPRQQAEAAHAAAAAAATAVAAEAEAAAAAAEAAAAGGVATAAAVRQALEAQAGAAAGEVAEHVRAAAAAGLAAGTSNAELLTSLNQAAAAAYGRAADAAEDTAERVAEALGAQAVPLQAALASLGALEAQLDRLAEVVGRLEAESRAVEAEVQAAGGTGQAAQAAAVRGQR